MGSRIIEIPAVREANVQVSIVSGTVIVKDESGNVIDRSSNAADAIKAAIRAIDSGVISFQRGVYNIDREISLKSNITFIGEEGVIFKCNHAPGFNTGTGGYSDSTIKVASNANSGTTQIKLSGVSGLNVGNYLKISDDYTVPYERKNVYKNGELAKIVAINGSTVTIDKPLYDSYTLSRNARVREISMLENIRFENIKFKGYGMDRPSTAVYFYATKNVTFSNCGIEEFGTRAISLFDCLDCTVENSTFKRVFKGGTGYGIAITNACDNIIIKNNSFLEKGRHYIAVVSSSGGVTTDGFARHVDVLNNTFRDCEDEAVNSHPTSAPIFRVIGNEIYDSRKGVELARTDSIVKDNKFYRCQNALVTLSTGNHIIEGNYFNGNRISIIPHATSNIIRNNVFDNGGYISPELNVVIESNTFRNYSGYIIHAPDTRGISELKNIEISNNICEDPLKVAMELKSASNVKLNNNNLKGDLILTKCDDVEIGCNRIDSPETSGVRVIDAKGPHTIKDNTIKARSVGISLENTGSSRNNEKILIAHNAVDAPKLYSNKDYSNVVVEKGTPICPTPPPMRMQDSRLREGSPDTVYKDVPYIDLGGAKEIGGYRDLVMFDLSKYNNADQIEKATLSLFWYYPEGKERTEDTVVEIYRPEAWNPDHVTWNSKDHNTSWANPGGDWHDLNNVPQGSTPYAKIAIKGSDVPDNRYHELDVTELVKAYVSGKYENTGFLIKASTERGNYIAFYSSDCKIGECAPKLDVKLNPAPVVHVLRKLKDSRLRQGSPDTVYKDVPYIDLGGAKEIVGYRDLLHFDLSELNNADLIEKAILSLFWYYPEGKERTEDTVVEIYRPETWNPNHVTWNNKDLNTRWENAGGDWYDLNNVLQGSTPYAKVAIKGSDVPDNSYHELDVTELVKAYVSGKYENTGFLIKAHTESGNYIAFCSSDYEDENKRPVLTVSEKA